MGDKVGGKIMSEKKVGTIIEVEGDYFLQTSEVRAVRKKERAHEQKEMIKIGSAAEKERYSKLVGQKAEVILSEPVRSVVGIAVKPIRPIGFPCYFILCYIPVPWWQWILPVLNKEMIEPLAQQFLQEGILSQENFNRVMDAASVQ